MLRSLFCIMGFGFSVYGAVDPCDFREIYNETFSYCVPEPVLKEWLGGVGFGREEPYSDEERERLCADIRTIYQGVMKEGPVKEKVAILSAGAPGAGKTYLMRAYLEKGDKHAYVDPDDVCLKRMERTWGREAKESVAGRRRAYDKWRPGSNAAAHLILAHLIRQGYGFYFGTTSTNPRMPHTFRFLKEQGYHIHLIHVMTPDNIRWESIKERDKVFVQTTEEDIREKGKLVVKRLGDAYLPYVDQIDFHYRDQVHGAAQLAAVWKRGEGLKILCSEAYEKLVTLHDAICDKVGDSSLKWSKTLSRAEQLSHHQESFQ